MRLDQLCPAAQPLRRSGPQVPGALSSGRQADVVMVMGLPGAGKSTVARGLAADGYLRLNRDDAGGTLRNLVPALERALDGGATRVVLDNTYVSRASRAAVIQAAAAHGAAVRCLWMATPIADAQVNVASRLVERHGTLPDVDDLAALRKRDPAALAPNTLYRYQRELEPPDVSEGFSHVEVLPFERRRDAASANRAVIVWCDGILLRSRSGLRRPANLDDLLVDPRHGAILREHAIGGFQLLGLSWQPEIAEQKRSAADAEALFARMNQALGLTLDVSYCPHRAGPAVCWCRKPLPGLGVLLMHRHRLDPAASIFVGEGTQDEGYARQLGFDFRSAAAFFAIH